MLPFVGPSYTLPDRAASAQRAVNLYLQIMETLGKAQSVMQVVPGCELFANMGPADAPPPPPPPPPPAPLVFEFDFNFIESGTNDMEPVGTEYQTNPGTNSQTVVFSGTSTVLRESYTNGDFPDMGFADRGGTLGFDQYDTPPAEGITTVITVATPFRRRYLGISLDKLGEFELKLTTSLSGVASTDIHVTHFDLELVPEWSSLPFAVYDLDGDLADADRQITGIKFVRGMSTTSFSPYYYVDNVYAIFSGTIPTAP